MSLNYDLIVIGAGLLGSSSTYHASKIQGLKIAHIGPPEPENKNDVDYHGAWQDEGRIFTAGSSSPIWSELDGRSSRCFQKLEDESGIQFFEAAGGCYFDKDSESIRQVSQNSKNDGFDMNDISRNHSDILPFMNFPENVNIIYDSVGSGYISPRNLVRAFRKVAKKNGVTHVEDIASRISENKDGSDWKWKITTEKSGVYQCKKVLVAVGAYASFQKLFEDVMPGFTPNLELRTQTVCFLEVDTNKWDMQRKVPSTIAGFDFQGLDGFYMLPPIKYPNGKVYLKIGHGRNYERVLKTLDEVSKFYKEGPYEPKCLQDLEYLVRYLIPDLPIISTMGGGGVTAHTPTELPYIEEIEAGFTVCLGGNGHAAKSSYEIGRLAFQLAIEGHWDEKFNKEHLKMQWKSV